MFKKIKNRYSSISQLRKNVISGSVMSLSNIFIMIISYPLYLHFIGVEFYGLWSTLTVVITFGELGYLGIAQSITKFVAEEWGKENKKAISGYITSSFIIILVPTLTILFILYFFRDNIAVFLNLENQYLDIAEKLIPLIGLLAAIMFSSSIFRGVVMGIGKVDLANYIFASSNILKVVFVILLMILGFNIWALIFGSFFQFILLLIIYPSYLRISYKIKVFSTLEIDRAKFKNLLSFGSNIVGSNILNMALLPFLKIFITKYIGLAEVTYFDISWKGTNFIRNFIERGLFALMPRASELSTKLIEGSSKRIKGIHDKGVKFAAFIGVPVFTIGFLFSDQIIRLWLQKQYIYEVAVLFKYFCAAIGISILFIPAYYILMGIGKVRYCFFHNVIKSFLLLFVIGFLYYFNIYNLENIVIAFCASTVIAHLYIGLIYMKFFRNEYDFIEVF